MNGGIIATIVAIISLLVTFLVGRKSGAIKENEKLRLNLEAYTEKMEAEVKNAKTEADTAEKKADLSAKVAEAITNVVSSAPVQSIQVPADDATDEEALRIAQQQAQQAREFMLR
ncbi:MAG: hypothetical protein II903_10100 [Spirochaetales bacterium]|nr:hypothetical protein [Spirochaetales bacterium]